MEVEVLGAGCANCHALEARVRDALDRLGVEGSVTLITDLPTIAGRGVMSTPALVVDGRVVMSGWVPTVDEIEALLGVS